MPELTGYSHPDYAASLAEFGEPYRLSRCGASVILRPIAGSDRRDALGTYPLLCAANWKQLAMDLNDLAQHAVSLTAVLDPFADFSEPVRNRCFPDFARPYKEHLVARLDGDPAHWVDAHHRYYARWSAKRVVCEIVESPGELLDDWMRLYGMLVARHEIAGIRAFSRKSFEKQLSIPGLTAIRCVADGRTVAAQLWFQSGAHAYSHLTCSDEEGYKTRASYALYWFALNHFRGIVSALDLGAGAGNSPTDHGLETFKRGWANDKAWAYLVGRVFDSEAYEVLTRETGTPSTSYFPAYRCGEFV